MFGLFSKKKESVVTLETADNTAPEIIGLRLGGAFELDTLNLKLMEPQIIIEGAASTQFIQAVGIVELDSDTTILRYYTDDDGFVQVMLSGGMDEEHIQDVKLFYYYNTTGIATQASWDEALADKIGLPLYELEGYEFTPVWADVSGNAVPVGMTERTTLPGSKDETDQFAMLYEREVDGDFYEFLFVSGEEKIIDNRHDRCLVVSTGVNLSPTDISIIG